MLYIRLLSSSIAVIYFFHYNYTLKLKVASDFHLTVESLHARTRAADGRRSGWDPHRLSENLTTRPSQQRDRTTITTTDNKRLFNVEQRTAS